MIERKDIRRNTHCRLSTLQRMGDVEALRSSNAAMADQLVKFRRDKNVDWVDPTPATHAIFIQLKAGETADLISRV